MVVVIESAQHRARHDRLTMGRVIGQPWLTRDAFADPPVWEASVKVLHAFGRRARDAEVRGAGHLPDAGRSLRPLNLSRTYGPSVGVTTTRARKCRMSVGTAATNISVMGAAIASPGIAQ